MKLRQRPEWRRALAAFVADGIYGLQPARATVAFQVRFGLRPDGIVGPRTREIAQTLGMVPVPFLAGSPPPAKPTSPGEIAVPVIPIGPPPPPAPAPPGPQGSSREVSWRRLRAEGWTRTGAVQTGLTSGSTVIQSGHQSSGDYVDDETR